MSNRIYRPFVCPAGDIWSVSRGLGRGFGRERNKGALDHIRAKAPALRTEGLARVETFLAGSAQGLGWTAAHLGPAPIY
ncbi:hypothetical protein VTK56DRAFT_5859 [Thermocarpiscus australiensis]